MDRNAHRHTLPLVVIFGSLLLTGMDAPVREEGIVALEIQPREFSLRGKDARQRLIATLIFESGRRLDVSSKVRWTAQPADAILLEGAIATAKSDGPSIITAFFREAGDTPEFSAEARAETSATQESLPVDFASDVQPILTRQGCNSGPCHGKARGQNGFQLSLLAFDSDFDYSAIVQEARGRRVFPASPKSSLLLRKPSAAVPHGGGKKLDVDGVFYRTLERWIASGMPRSVPTPKLLGIEVQPSQLSLSPSQAQQLIVTARYEDGSRKDVTHWSQFQSSESPVVDVDANGLLEAGPIPGEAAIMSRFMGRIAVTNVLIPLPGNVPEVVYEKLPREHFIDVHVWKKLQQLGIVPSNRADDATFFRRVTIDIIGRLPTLEESRSFLSELRAGKRERLIDYLLARPEYADHWAGKWADLLRPNPYRVGIKAVYNLDAWIRESFRANKPYDVFVKEVICANGSTFQQSAATVFRDRRTPDELTTLFSQLFLGIRLECAKCHQHPFEKWGQDDFYGMAAYFSRVARKGTGLSPPISGSEEMVFAGSRGGTVPHPLTQKPIAPRPLFGEAPPVSEFEDYREALAIWIASDDNEYFARVIVNRIWADLMGRGLVEPVDDLRATNPASNDPLLAALAQRFREDEYDLKKLIRVIVTSSTYALSSATSPRNQTDTRNYSRHYRRRLRAENLLDSVHSVTGVAPKFDALPPGSRAAEFWTHRSPSLFLDTFGRPDPNQDPPCERIEETSVVQALHLMNARDLQRMISSDTGRAARLAAGSATNEELATEFYLLTYCRYPSIEELRFATEGLAATLDRRRAAEDLLWALLNSPEFLLKN